MLMQMINGRVIQNSVESMVAYNTSNLKLGQETLKEAKKNIGIIMLLKSIVDMKLLTNMPSIFSNFMLHFCLFMSYLTIPCV